LLETSVKVALLLRFAKLVFQDTGMEEPDTFAPAASFDADRCGKMGLSSVHVALQDKALSLVHKTCSLQCGNRQFPWRSKIIEAAPVKRFQ